jgi:hypothetical protein
LNAERRNSILIFHHPQKENSAKCQHCEAEAEFDEAAGIGSHQSELIEMSEMVTKYWVITKALF